MPAVNSYFLNTLKLFTVDRYDISDKDLKSLSDIILSYGFKDVAQEGDLINLIIIRDKHDIKMPCSINYFRVLWTKEFNVVNVMPILKKFVEDGLITVQTVTPAVFDKVQQSPYDKKGEDRYPVIYSTRKLEEFFDRVLPFFSKKKQNVQESVATVSTDVKMSTKHDRFFNRMKTELSNQGMTLELQIYSPDTIVGETEISFQVSSKTDDISKVGDKEALKVLKKFVGNNHYINELDINVDDRNTLYIDLTIDDSIVDIELSKLAMYICTAVKTIFSGSGV